jgi:hypothetical protein
MPVGTSCHPAAPRENVPVNTGLSEFFRDTLGANSPAPPEGTQTFNLQEPGQRDSLHGEVTRQREIWRAREARDYDFLLRSSCFCPGRQGWLLLEVRGSQVVRIRDTKGRPAPLAEYRHYSVDGLFDILDQQADRDDLVAVAFDDRWHYPVYVRTDVRLALPDDWGVLQLRGFRLR